MTDINEKDLLGLIEEVKHERISRKQFVYRALGLGLSASAVGGILAACGKKDSGGTTAETNTIGETTKPAEMYLYNWSDYMPASVKKDFEKETGIKVVETFFDDNEALLAKLKAGATGYDVCVPSDYMAHIMIMTGLLEPLVMEYIPNFANVDSQFRDPMPRYDDPASPENKGNQFTIPYQWGTTGIGVRTDKTDAAAITAWSNLWDANLKGQIQMLNDERETPGAALMMTGVRDSGKPYSINTLSQTELDAATQSLIDQKPLVRAYDSVNMKRSMVSGTTLTHCWNGDVLMAIDALGGYDNAKNAALLKYVLASEGVPLWTDTMCIPTGFRNKYGAHLWLDYTLRPEVQAKISSWTWYLPVMVEPATNATPPLDPFVLTTVPTAEEVARSELYNDIGDFSRAYTDAWSKVKSS
jgi:spermidine/putrescine-binding protein